MTLLNYFVILAADNVADIPEGTPLNLSEGFGVALFCISIVFGVLASLFILIKIFSVGIRFIEARAVKVTPAVKVAPAAKVTPAADAGAASHLDSGRTAYTGQLRLRDVDEPTAALIMAVVSDESGIPLSELCFKSIRKKS